MQVAFHDTEATTGVLLQGLNDDILCVQNATGEKVRCPRWLCCEPAVSAVAAGVAHASRTVAALSDLRVNAHWVLPLSKVGQFIHNMATAVGGFAIGEAVGCHIFARRH